MKARLFGKLSILLLLLFTITLSLTSCSSDDKDEESAMYVFKIRNTSAAFESNPLLTFTVQSIYVSQYDEDVSYFLASNQDDAIAKFRRAVSQIKSYHWDTEFELSQGTYFTLQLVTGQTVVASEIITLK